jgi:hypothetical protein
VPCIAGLALLLLVGLEALADDGRICLEDLPRYEAALRTSSGSPRPVGFRDMWEHADRYRDQLVRVQGRVERRFGQPAQGKFPALTETWIVDEAGNPFCLVSPTDSKSTAGVGTTVRFAGTFLKLVQYEGQDGPRRAPLIVGPAAPVIARAVRPAVAETGRRTLDWIVGMAAATFVLAVLALLHFRRPRRRVPAIGPPPEFLTAESEYGPIGTE